MRAIREKIERVLSSGSADLRRPVVKRGNESSVPGLHIIGDLAGAPVIKLAMAQGVEVIDYLSTLPEMQEKRRDPGVIDILVVGAGAAGLNAALAAQEKGYSCVVIEKGKIANTIENFPEGKWVYAEPDQSPPKGKLWLDGAQKEDLVGRWSEIVRANRLDVRVEESLESFTKPERHLFLIKSSKGEHRARKIVLATGQRGNPRQLGVPGEDAEWVYHRLYSPRHYRGEEILVVGGGNSAIEAALVLADQNRVVLSYRGAEFSRIFKDNERKLAEAVAAKRIEVLLQSQVKSFGDRRTTLVVSAGGRTEERVLATRHAFVLVGADLPVAFLRGLGIRLENEWTGSLARAAGLTLLALAGLWFYGGRAGDGAAWAAGVPAWLGGVAALASIAGLVAAGLRGDRWAWLGLSFFAWYSVYGIKVGAGREFWPYNGWGYASLTFFDRGWAFWYTVMYTMLMTVFGIGAIQRWGIRRKDKFQIWRFVSLLSFQWIFFFLVPEYLFQAAVEHRWIGDALASDPKFAEQAWRSYGLVYAWPLFFYTFFHDPHIFWVVWGIFLSFVLIPILVIFIGKRYCSWICGCGGLAETFGDRWRHLAPKGKAAISWEKMGVAVLVLAIAVTAMKLLEDTVALLRTPTEWAMPFYQIVIDVWLIGILPVTLYPFLGGKVWCRYWCPLAKMMELFSRFYAKTGISQFKITANDKCIGCNECSRNCQVGIPVMQYALKQEVLDNATSSCIGCGICVSACPMDVLAFGTQPQAPLGAAHHAAQATAAAR